MEQKKKKKEIEEEEEKEHLQRRESERVAGAERRERDASLRLEQQTRAFEEEGWY